MPNSSNEKKTTPDDKTILAKLKEHWDLGKQYYERDQRRMRILDMTDNGERWRAIGANFEPYQILPDTNGVSYVKDQLLASLYTTAKSAEVRPTSEDDAELCTKLNIALDHIWSIESVGFKQFQAGERAALVNLGLTQVGWEEDFIQGDLDKATLQKGRVVLQNINPMNFMRDPFSRNLHEASWCCTYDRYHKSILLDDSRYKEEFKKYLESKKNTGSSELLPGYGRDKDVNASKDHYNLIRWWIKTPDNKINELHTIDEDVILYRKEDIQPAVFPFAELYCNLPSSGLVGISCPAKIFANDTAYNLLSSLALTYEYKNQRPPKFVSASSGLNIPAFTRYGAEADRTFIVNGEADKAVHYHQFPQMSPNVPNLLQTLQMDIKDISGVDDKYTGRDTGSIITTGGTEEMLNRVTMIDTPKIMNYEQYTKDLTKLILLYMLEFSPKRKYFVRKKNSNEYETVEVDFPKINKDTLFEYAIEISSELPKNKQRVAAWADMIMEKQMQYRQNGGNVELITEEEWLQFQDVPFKEQLLERMGFERDTNALKETTQALFQYANLIEQGVAPEDALLQTAQTLEKSRRGEQLDDAEMAMTQPQQMPAPMPMESDAAVPIM